jgi:hypothetical protein
MSVDDKIFGVTTLIQVSRSRETFHASGFFYDVLSGENAPPGWSMIDSMWMVTNKHVLLETIQGFENLPDALTINFRKIDEKHIVRWHPIDLYQEDLIKRMKLHPNKKIDVAVRERIFLQLK